jgi:hypothetical protein
MHWIMSHLRHALTRTPILTMVTVILKIAATILLKPSAKQMQALTRARPRMQRNYSIYAQK